MTDAIRTGVLTISDRCSRGNAEDRSGPALCEQLENEFAAEIARREIVADDVDVIATALRAWCAARPPVELILTTGGTGLGPRDVTPEATQAVIERPHAGLMELIRMRCGATFPRAYLSRGIAGVCEQTLIINLPGSPKGAVESLAALEDVLPHAIAMLRGGDH